MTTYKNEWEVKGQLSLSGTYFVNSILETIRKQLPEYFEFSPFKIGWKCEVLIDDTLFSIRIEEIISSIPHMGGTISNKDLVEKIKYVFNLNQYPNFNECFDELKDEGYNFGLFTYIGKVERNNLCWQHISDVIVNWLNKIVIPRILEMNTKRVTDAIPTPPTYDISKLLENIYVIESENGMKQGTAFHLQDIGIITCDHCLRNDVSNDILRDLVIFKGNNQTKKYSVKIINTNQDLDISLIDTSKELLSEGLSIGSSDILNQLDHIGVAGFPNYKYGDNGIFSPGLIVGFRTYSGIRHILINSPLISGNSGGPAFDKNSRVIGIAVTGADKMSKAHETEKHGLIPIEAINYIK